MKATHTEKALFLAVILSLPGCFGQKQKPQEASQQVYDESLLDLNMVEEDEVADFAHFFEAEEFDAQEISEVTAELEKEVTDLFSPIYYEYDAKELKDDQGVCLAINAEKAIELISQAREEGKEPVLVVEGHSCSAGKASPEYKLALSEKRAEEVANALIACGVDKDVIKVVGVGEGEPIMRDGKPLSGNSEEQAANRRVQMRLEYN